MPAVTNTPIQHSYFVADIADAVAAYNRLRWWRSRDGQNGLYEAATASSPAAATLLGGDEEPHDVDTRTFSFRVNGITRVDVVLSGTDLASTIASIALATALVVASDDAGRLRLTTVATGSGASIEILDGDANPFLGFSEGDAAVGLDSDLTLVAGTHEYFYTDQNSSEEFWYRVEFLNTATAATTGLGVPFPASRAQGVPKSQTITCYVRLSDMSGAPIQGRRITFHNVFQPNRVAVPGRSWGVFRHYAEMVTDRNGYAEIRLLRGILIDFAVDGTDFVRRIEIPTTGDIVDILDPALVAEDEFGIQEPNIDFAIRTS